MKNRLIPFRALPASWGLKGDPFLIAEAHYYYEDEELDRKLIAINHRNNPKMLERQSIELDFRHGHIDTYTYDHRIAKLELDDPNALRLREIEIEEIHGKMTTYEAARQRIDVIKPTGIDREVSLLEIEHQYNRITKAEFEKRRANLRNEPWVAIINSGFNPEQGIDGVFFEFDWNEHWIEFLKQQGYVGHSPEQIVDDWFTDVCRSHSTAELAGSITPSRNLHRD